MFSFYFLVLHQLLGPKLGVLTLLTAEAIRVSMFCPILLAHTFTRLALNGFLTFNLKVTQFKGFPSLNYTFN